MNSNAIDKKENPIKRFLSIRGMGQVVTVTVGLIIMAIVFSFLNPSFFSSGNMKNISRQVVPYLLIGVAQSYVLITGNIDLSIGSVVGMSSMMAATLMQNGYSPLVAIAVTMATSLAFGFLNGQLVARFKLPPFIATLGTMTVCRGIAQLVNGNRNTSVISPGDKDGIFKNLFYDGNTLGIYNGFIIAIIMFAIFTFFLYKTKAGKHIFAIGSNIEAAKLSGVNVVSTTVTAYMVSAFLSCVTGFVICAATGTGTMDAGNTFELYAVAASVIGGVSTLGGSGLLFGTFIGAFIWIVLENGLQFARVPTAYKNIIIGVIVVVSVLLDVILRSGSNITLFKKIGNNMFGRKDKSDN